MAGSSAAEDGGTITTAVRNKHTSNPIHLFIVSLSLRLIIHGSRQGDVTTDRSNLEAYGIDPFLRFTSFGLLFLNTGQNLFRLPASLGEMSIGFLLQLLRLMLGFLNDLFRFFVPAST